MSDIPLNYHTAYEWTGDGEKGEIKIGELPTLPIGSPHNLERYCPEHILVVAVEACLANYVLLIAQMSRLNVKAYQSVSVAHYCTLILKTAPYCDQIKKSYLTK